MTTEFKPDVGPGCAEAETVQCCHLAEKWAAAVCDSLYPLPRRKLLARDVLDQSGHGQDVVLVRDHGGVQDVVFDDNAEVDLADGNVFRVMPRCEVKGHQNCTEPAKRAYVCDDEWEVTLVGRQTGRSLKRLLGLNPNMALYRDYKSPHDEPIADDEVIEFSDGPVFTCFSHGGPQGIPISVNGREKAVEAKTISYAELIVLAFGARQPDTIYTVDFKYGPPSNPSGSMVDGDSVKLQCGMAFNVTDSGRS